MKHKSLSSSAQRVQEVLEDLGFSYRVIELSQTTRSAGDAAKAIGCKIGQIAKSFILRLKKKPILVIQWFKSC